MHSKKSEKIVVVLMTAMLIVTLAGLWTVRGALFAPVQHDTEVLYATYTSPALGVSFQYPASWTVSEDGSVITLESLPKTGVAPLGHYPYMQLAVCQKFEECAHSLPSQVVQTKRTETQIAGVGASLFATDDSNNFFHAAVDKGATTYYITTFADTNDTQKPDSVIAPVLDSLTWEPIFLSSVVGYMLTDEQVGAGEFASYSDESLGLSLTVKNDTCEEYIAGIATPEPYSQQLRMEQNACSLIVQKQGDGFRIVEQNCSQERADACSYAGLYITGDEEIGNETIGRLAEYSFD